MNLAWDSGDLLPPMLGKIPKKCLFFISPLDTWRLGVVFLKMSEMDIETFILAVGGQKAKNREIVLLLI